MPLSLVKFTQGISLVICVCFSKPRALASESSLSPIPPRGVAWGAMLAEGEVSRTQHNRALRAKQWIRATQSVVLLAFVCTFAPLGIAQTQARIIRSKVCRRGEPTYNPTAHVLSNHCFFAAFLRAHAVPDPSLQEVHILRHLLGRLWMTQAQGLQYVADEAKLTKEQYVEGIKRTYWGGLPDAALLSTCLRSSVTIEDGMGRTLLRLGGARRQARMRWEDNHYVLHRPGGKVVSNWAAQRLFRKLERVVRRLETKAGDIGPRSDKQADLTEEHGQEAKQQYEERRMPDSNQAAERRLLRASMDGTWPQEEIQKDEKQSVVRTKPTSSRPKQLAA